MLVSLLNDGKWISLLGLLTAFGGTFLLTGVLAPLLPKDGGREFAVDGKKSAGKPRGAGIIFVLVFVAAVLLFVPVQAEIVIYMILIAISMMTGFLDDAAKTPWGEYKKGFLDLCVAAMVAITFLKFNSSVVELAFFGVKFVLHPVVFALLTVVLVWTSVNVTNCADGVDGLSATLVLITLGTIFAVNMIKDKPQFSYTILLFMACLLAYLWYNATPSSLMMGDAGSRAMGLLISIAILKTGCPVLYIPVAIVLILDGGLGLVKVALLRFLKIHILKNTRTPLHDHVRKNKGWSNTHTVFRFAILQMVVSVITIWLIQK